MKKIISFADKNINMENIERILEKIKIVRKEKGYSHENIANDLGISQPAYTNIEKNVAKLTVERLLKISEILEKPVYHFFDSSPNNVYNQQNSENPIGNINNLYQENKEANERLVGSYENTIQSLKDEIIFLRKLLEKK